MDDFLRQLEDEIQKMAALEHHFPIFSNLLKDVVAGFDRLKEEIMGRRNLELKLVEGNSNGVQRGYMPNGMSNYRNHVTTWNSGLNPSDVHRRNLEMESPRRIKDENDVEFGGNNTPIQIFGTSLTLGSNQTPFSQYSEQIAVPMIMGRSSLVDPMIHLGQGGEGNGNGNGRIVVDDESKNIVMIPRKKQRRRWSEEMCKSFRNAVLRLGGPRRATPKKILKIMKVEGLTNDEVKSHLQKYRHQMESVAASASKNPGSS